MSQSAAGQPVLLEWRHAGKCSVPASKHSQVSKATEHCLFLLVTTSDISHWQSHVASAFCLTHPQTACESVLRFVIAGSKIEKAQHHVGSGT